MQGQSCQQCRAELFVKRGSFKKKGPARTSPWWHILIEEATLSIMRASRDSNVVGLAAHLRALPTEQCFVLKKGGRGATFNHPDDRRKWYVLKLSQMHLYIVT